MKTDHQVEVLERMLDPVSQVLTPDVARRLLALRADPIAQQRIEELADKCTEGQLSDEERAEYESYVSAVNVLSVLQAKARALLVNQQTA
ncbi:MAG: hypothetical protein HRF43_11405 [Phycisphaerae bacterium]|jgi:hypothetical protein